MSGVLLNDFSNSDSNILKVQSTLDKTFFGKVDSITLTEFDSSTVPAIAAGSVVENNGSLYQFASEEAISTTDPGTSSTVADGTVYVLLVPGTGTITAAFTATAPTWSDSKQGWYGTGDEANYRYLPYYMTKVSTVYSKKYTFPIKNNSWYAIPTATVITDRSISESVVTQKTSTAATTTFEDISPTFTKTLSVKAGQIVCIYSSVVLRSSSSLITASYRLNINGPLSSLVPSGLETNDAYMSVGVWDNSTDYDFYITAATLDSFDENEGYSGVKFFIAADDGTVTMTESYLGEGGATSAIVLSRKFLAKIIDFYDETII